MTQEMAAGRINPNWTGANIFSLVVGFVIFWPVGLAFLYLILTGRDVPQTLQRGWHILRDKVSGHRAGTGFGQRSGNAVFDDHLRAEYARLELEKRRLEDEKVAFAEFLDRLGKERDREIFNQWRAERDASRRVDT